MEYNHEEVLCWQGAPRRPAFPFDCTMYHECFCPPIEADPEIAGPGVIAAFVASAAITITATLICLILHKPRDGGDTSPPIFNPIDRVACHLVCEPPRRFLLERGFDPEVYAGCTYDVVMTLSDQQLVTGIALLVTAIAKMFDGSISAYHFNMATDLAWFSGNTHLLAMLVFRKVKIESVKRGSAGREANPHNTLRSARFARLLRIVLMAALAGLMLYVFWVSGYGNWYAEFRCPVLCMLGGKKSGSALQWMVVNFVLILYNYPINIFLLWRTGCIFWVDRVRHHVVDEKAFQLAAPGCGGSGSLGAVASTKEGSWKEGRGGIQKGRKLLLTIPHSIFLAFWYTLSSEVWHVLELLVWFGLGIFWTVGDRRFGHDLMESKQVHKESEIGFGQLIPLLLLLLPFMQAFDSFARLSAEAQGRQGEQGANN